MMYTVVAVAVVAIAAVAVFVVLNNSSSDDHSAASFEDTRLRIYGNANGDDVIDKTDVNLIKWIVDCNTDDDNANDVDWQKDYPLADANYDDKVTSADVDVTQKIVNKEKTKMYYFNKYERVTYVNYPISDKIGGEYLIIQLLPAIGSYDMLKAIDSTTPTIYSNVYPGVNEMPILSRVLNMLMMPFPAQPVPGLGPPASMQRMPLEPSDTMSSILLLEGGTSLMYCVTVL
jgi:hypothetical protein